MNVLKTVCGKYWQIKALLKKYFHFTEEVFFELHPVFDSSEDGIPQASIVWIGDQDARPSYVEQVDS